MLGRYLNAKQFFICIIQKATLKILHDDDDGWFCTIFFGVMLALGACDVGVLFAITYFRS